MSDPPREPDSLPAAQDAPGQTGAADRAARAPESTHAPAPAARPSARKPAPRTRPSHRERPRSRLRLVLLLLLTLVTASASTVPVSRSAQAADAQAMRLAILREINPPEGYTLPVRFGDLGPRLVAAGAIDVPQFTAVFVRSGRPLSEAQLALVTAGSEDPVVLDQASAQFVLNFLWALGLTNRNPLLTDGPMTRNSGGQIERFASTGGWTIGARPAGQLYASAELVPLTPEQQSRLETAAERVFRPCCNNPTSFPDCNHGMAMLGLLELLAAQDASVEAMLRAAKAVNAFWFPQQSFELALFFQANTGLRFSEIPAAEFVGERYASGSGARAVNAWLAERGLLEQPPGSGGSCGV